MNYRKKSRKKFLFDEEINNDDDFEFNQVLKLKRTKSRLDKISRKLMKKYIKALRQKFNKYNIDGYVIPKMIVFTEYSKINRLKIISNLVDAGLAVILKNKNYLFTDGRYTIQSQLESGKNFKIYGFEKLINCSLFKNLTLGIDPNLFPILILKIIF